MSLQCGITGITNTGKTTLFNCMSNTKAEVTDFAFGSRKSNIGIVQVPDPRLYELEKFQTTEKIVHATVEIIDIPGLIKGSSQGEGVGNQFLSDIRNCNALIHVLRCFDDDHLPHVEGSVDPVRDKEIIDFELQIKDMESVEKKSRKLKKMAKTGDKDAAAGLQVLKKIQIHLEDYKPVRTLSLTDEEKKVIQDMSLLSSKPVLYVCNVEEASAVTGNDYVEKVRTSLRNEPAELIIMAGAMEAEIAELEEADERTLFLQDMGLKEPGVDKVIRAAYHLLNLQTFFTVGPKEIKAWTIRMGMTAPEAAGVIHSDLERGFIRAEVMKYEDFITLGSEHACKEAGKFHIEGKNYVVEDGDILNIRFNI